MPKLAKDVQVGESFQLNGEECVRVKFVYNHGSSETNNSNYAFKKSDPYSFFFIPPGEQVKTLVEKTKEEWVSKRLCTIPDGTLFRFTQTSPQEYTKLSVFRINRAGLLCYGFVDSDYKVRELPSSCEVFIKEIITTKEWE